MNPMKMFGAIALGGITVLTVCHFLSEATAASSPMGLGSPSAANAKLEQAVNAMLKGDEELRSADLTVRADVTKNEVTLAGTVGTEVLRSRAVELAKNAHAGVTVKDKIIVHESRGGK